MKNEATQSMTAIQGMRLTLLTAAVSVVVVSALLTILKPLAVHAADLEQRSVTIGSSLANSVTNHTFRFTTATSGTIGSIKFAYCDSPLFTTTCNAPAGLDVSVSTLVSQVGLTGFTISAPDTTANTLVLTRSPASEGLVAATFLFDNITSPSTVNQTTFVRISTHASTDGSGPRFDDGAVAFYTVPGVGVGGYVPPFLTFCVGVTVSLDCSTTTGSLMTLGELTTGQTATATSQFAAATNDPSGYNTFVTGGTMTSGNEIIPQLSLGDTSSPGTSQFGINLRQNSNPLVGTNVSGVGSAQPTTGYGGVNSFRYNDGELIAQSTQPTEFNRFTVSYIVNRSAEQKPGVYASSYTFTAVASF